MTLKVWKKKCQRAADLVDISVVFYDENEAGMDDAYEDDGNLHVIRLSTRACFDVGNGQALSGVDQNINTKRVMAEIGLGKSVTDRVLVEEEGPEDDEPGHCPHCGREY